MRIAWLLVAALALSACGHKGGLKTPSQVEVEAQKKAAKEAKEQQKKEPPQEEQR